MELALSEVGMKWALLEARETARQTRGRSCPHRAPFEPQRPTTWPGDPHAPSEAWRPKQRLMNKRYRDSCAVGSREPRFAFLIS